jgi:hypothetical protein
MLYCPKFSTTERKSLLRNADLKDPLHKLPEIMWIRLDSNPQSEFLELSLLGTQNDERHRQTYAELCILKKHKI